MAYALSYDFSFNFGSFGTSEVQFSGPFDIAVNSTHIFVTDSANHRVQIFDPSGNFAMMFGKDVLSGVGAGGVFEKCTSSCSTGQSGTAAGEMNSPSGIAVNSTHIFVTDGISNDRVQIFDLSGNFAMMFGFGVADGSPVFQTCTSSCQAGIDGSGDGQFSWLGGIAVNSTHIFVADRINDDVQIFDLSGNFVDTFGTTGSGAGNLNQPFGIAVNSTHIFVAENSNVRVSVFDLSGNFVSMFGFDVDTTGGTGFEICTSSCKIGVGGTGNGQFANPSGIEIDSNGRIFVLDETNDDVQIFDSSFNIVDTIANSGGGSGDGELEGPSGIDIDSNDRVLVADVDNDRVSVFALSSAVEVGDFILSFDGTGGALFDSLEKVAVDSNNRIIVVDSSASVQIFDSTGSFVVALSGGTAFSNPQGAAVDSNNLIYAIDSGLVQVYDSTGSFTGTSFDGSEGLGTQFVDIRGIAIDDNDRIIVVGPSPDLVQIYSTSGTFLDSFDGTGGTTFSFAEAVAVDSNNRIIVGDSANDNVQIFDSTGTFVAALSGATTPAPNAIAVDDNDRILVAESSNDLVQIYDSTGSFQSSFDGSDGLGTQFPSPDGIAVDSNNRIIVADNNLVQIFEGFPPTPTLLTAVWDDADNADIVISTGDTLTITFDSATNRPGGTGTLAKGIVDNLFTFANSIGTDYTGAWTSATTFVITIVDATSATASIGDTVSAKGTLQFTGTLDTTGGTAFTEPQGIATNSTDFIFVGDRTNANVQIFNPDGTYSGVNLSGFSFGPSPDTIRDVHTNSTDFILVSEGDVNTILIFNPDGTYSGVTSSGGSVQNPYGVATNSTDHIFLADAGLNTVLIFDPTGSFQENVSGAVSDNPQGVAINSTNFVFEVNRDAAEVRIFNPDGTYSGVNLSGSTFNDPRGVATNSTDFIFVSDTFENNVQIFNPDGTFAGIVDTVGGAAFDTPLLLHVDNNDRVFVPDDTLNSVQIFSQGIRDSTSVSPPATGGTSTTGDFGVVVVPCTIETAPDVDTIISSNCTVTSSITAGGSVRVESGAVMTIQNLVTLDINFATKNLTVESGSGVLIKAGGAIN